MSQSDKTREKLVDSMRKTKAGSTEDKESVEADEQDKTEAPAPKKSAIKSSTTTAKKRSEKKTAAENPADGYQSVRRRVWPD